MLQSTEVFDSDGEARDELKRWKKKAAEDGYHMIGRVVPATDEDETDPSD